MLQLRKEIISNKKVNALHSNQSTKYQLSHFVAIKTKNN